MKQVVLLEILILSFILAIYTSLFIMYPGSQVTSTFIFVFMALIGLLSILSAYVGRMYLLPWWGIPVTLLAFALFAIIANYLCPDSCVYMRPFLPPF